MLTYRYESRRRDETALKMRFKEIADTRVHCGYRREHAMLRREGHQDNVKRVYRLHLSPPDEYSPHPPVEYSPV